MGNLSSIHFKKSIYIQTKHNDRTLPPSYLIGGEVEVNRNYQEADILKKQIIDEAMQKYTQRTKQRFQGKSYEWSAVVNLKEDSTMQDLERLALHFQKEYGLQCYQIAIHRDEGHIDENGEKKLNHHAHLEFITLDKDTGVNRFREIKLPTLRKIQSEVAEILGMERGVDNRISKSKRIEPRVYASLKEKEKIKNLSKFRKELIKEYTEKMKGKGFKQTDFQAMRGIANDEECKIASTLRQNIEDYLAERQKEMEQLKNANKSEEFRQELKKSNEMYLEAKKEVETLKNENNRLKKRFSKFKEKLRGWLKKIKTRHKKLEDSNVLLKSEFEKVKKAYDTAFAFVDKKRLISEMADFFVEKGVLSRKSQEQQPQQEQVINKPNQKSNKKDKDYGYSL